MDFEIKLFRSLDYTFMAEVTNLPGVLVTAIDAQAALCEIQALALRVLAERIESAELDPNNLAINFILDVQSQILLNMDKIRVQGNKTVSPDALEEIAEAIDPIQNVEGSIIGVITGAIGAITGAIGHPRPQSRRAADVLTALYAAGWREQRRLPTHRTLRNSQGEELVFPFREDDILRNELLDRFSTLGGVTF